MLALLAAAGFAYWLYSRMKSTAVTLDDIPGYLSAQPMDPDERFSADGSGDLTVALDKSDLWWLIDRLFGMGWEQEAVAALEPYQIEYDGVGLRLEDGSARIDAQAQWKSVVLRASIPLAVSCVDGELRAVPTGVEVGDTELILAAQQVDGPAIRLLIHDTTGKGGPKDSYLPLPVSVVIDSVLSAFGVQ